MSFASDQIAKIEAEMARRGDAGFVEDYSDGSGVGFRALSYVELERLRDKYAAEISRENSGGGPWGLARISR